MIRPFPQSLAGQQLWRAYRDDMLDFAGLAIFMFGNKLEGDPPTVAASGGVVEEFEIAHAKGTKVLPLGFTEYVARDLYERVRNDFTIYYPNATQAFQQQFTLLGDPTRSLDEQLRTTLDALVELQRMP